MSNNGNNALSLSDITHIISTLLIFGVLALYCSGEWKLYMICFALSYIIYIIYYNIYRNVNISKNKSIGQLKQQNEKRNNVLTMLKLDEINLIKPINDDINFTFSEKDYDNIYDDDIYGDDIYNDDEF